MAAALFFVQFSVIGRRFSSESAPFQFLDLGRKAAPDSRARPSQFALRSM
jgi:hypothetical protein